jgi:ribosomal protein L11 methyltransferase
MEWRQFVMDLDSIEADRVEEILLRHGAQAVSLTDAGDDPVLEPAPGTTPLWRDTRITALFAAGADFEDLRADLGRTLAIEVSPDNHVTAVDIDAQAQLATRQNALGNAVDERLETCAQIDRTRAPHDFVVANILAGILADEAETVCACLRPGGGLALSGILAKQVSDVAAAYDSIIEFAQPVYHDGWARLSGTRI